MCYNVPYLLKNQITFFDHTPPTLHTHTHTHTHTQFPLPLLPFSLEPIPIRLSSNQSPAISLVKVTSGRHMAICKGQFSDLAYLA